jgi:type VI secretion system protein ImpA
MVNFDALLQPIEPENPSGDDLRLDSSDTTFAKLEEMRQEIDPAIDPGGTAKRSDWAGVVKLASEALSTKSKDLELAAILTQGLVVEEGLPGLLTGLRLVKGMVTDFWETVHPGWDEGEIIEPIRARSLSWLGSSKDFLRAIKGIPLSAPIGSESYSWFDYEQSQRVDKAAIQADQGPFHELVAAGFISGEQWRGSLAGTPPERMEAVLTGLTDCLTGLEELNQACEEHFEDDSPYLLDLRNLLEEIHQYLEQFQTSSAGAGAPGPAVAQGQPTAQVQAAAVAPAGAAGSPGPIASRDDAYRRLREVAEYLRRTEPHSPVPPLLDRAVRWGNMTFEKLFEDVVKNKDAQNQTRDLLGLEDEKSTPKSVNSKSPSPAAGQSPKRMND